MTKEEIQQRVDELQTWHYNHVLPFGISTGESPIEQTHPKLIQLLEGGAFARRIYPKVLDLGANSGLFSIWFCDNRHSHVTAVEGNDRYFEQLKFIINIKGYEGRIQPVHQDLHVTSYGGNEYDLVLLLGVLHHLKPELHLDVLRACHKALIPAGEIVVQTDSNLPVEHMLEDTGFLSIEKLVTHWDDRAAWQAIKDPMKLW